MACALLCFNFRYDNLLQWLERSGSMRTNDEVNVTVPKGTDLAPMLRLLEFLDETFGLRNGELAGRLALREPHRSSSVAKVGVARLVQQLEELVDLPTAVARPRSIEAREIAAVTATAPTPRAKDFRIKFLEPKTK